jgi:transposase
LSSWLIAGIVPGLERQPLKKLAVDESALLKLLHLWREEAAKAGHRIKRVAVAFEAGRDGFWLARWLSARDIEAHVIHASSVAASREHRRAKTDRLDTELLKRCFLGWLRGERDHCKMVAIPTTKDEDAKRPNREHESLVGEQSRIVNRMKATLIRLGIRGFNPKLKKAAGRLEDLLELSYRRARSAIRTNVATTGAIVRIDCSTQYYKHRFCADGFWPPRIGTSETRPIA